MKEKRNLEQNCCPRLLGLGVAAKVVLLLLTSTNKNESYLHYIYERERENERLEAQERKLRSSRKENVFSVRSCGSGLWSLDTFIFLTMENIYIIKYKIQNTSASFENCNFQRQFSFFSSKVNNEIAVLT